MTDTVRHRGDDFVHRVITPKFHRHHIAADWCRQQFGPRWSVTENRGGRWCVFWRGFGTEHDAAYEWLFVDQADAVLFALRWQ